jgi:hypothetical protein
MKPTVTEAPGEVAEGLVTAAFDDPIQVRVTVIEGRDADQVTFWCERVRQAVCHGSARR